MDIFIPASKVAALTGRHNYCSVAETTIEILKRYSKNIFEKLVRAYQKEILIYKHNCELIFKHFPDLRSKIEKNWSTHKEIYKNLRQIEKVKNFLDSCKVKEVSLIESQFKVETLKEIKDATYNNIRKKYGIETLINAFETLTPKEEKAHQVNVKDITNINIETPTNEIACLIVDPDIRTRIAMDRGHIRESLISSRLSKQFPYTRYDNSLRIKKLKTPNGNIYKVGGRIDLFICNSSGAITGFIEIKARTKKLFKNIPSHDIDQLAVYYFLVNQLDNYYLVQEFENNLDIREYSKKKLEKRWLKLKVALDVWVDKIYELEKRKYFHPEFFSMLEKYTNLNDLKLQDGL